MVNKKDQPIPYRLTEKAHEALALRNLDERVRMGLGVEPGTPAPDRVPVKHAQEG